MLQNLNNVTVLRKPVYAVRQCIDKGSILKLTIAFPRVLVLIISLRPIADMFLSEEAIECVQKLNKQR